MADYADLFSTYLQNRMDQATQPFTDPSAYAQKRFGETFPTGETEEEKKKRLAKEANTPIQTQTVNHYADGSQEHNVTTQIPAPVAPESIPAAAPPAPPAQPVQAVAPQPPPQMAPPPPQMAPAMAPPANPATPIINDQGQTLGHETPQQMVQGAATNAPIQQAPAAPVNPAAPQMTPAVSPAPAVAQPPDNPAAAPTSTAESLPGLQQQPYIDLLMQGQKDPAMLAKLQNDRNAPEFVRQAANTHLLGHLNAYQGQQDAETRAKDLEARANAGDPKATREIAKEFSSSTEEGSYIKAYLLQRFGLHDLANQEQIKLGAGSTMQQITLPSGDTALVRVRGDGVASYGHNVETGKQLDQRQLEEATGAYRKGATTGHTMYTDANGHVITMTTVPGQANPVFYNSTTGQTLKQAPAGLKPLSQVDYREKMSDQAAVSAMRVMRNENTKAVAQGAPAPYSEEQIQTAGNQARLSAYHGTPQGGPSSGVTPTVTTPGGAPAVTPPAGKTSGQINNNPGNIMYGPKAIAMGATDKAPNGTAIFPNMVAGDSAHDQLLSGDTYKNMNLHQIVSKWAPNNENNPAQYARTVKGMLGGIDMEKTYNELTPTEKQTFREAQYKIEHGGEPGVGAPKAEVIKSPIRQQAESIYNGDVKMPTGMGANNYRSRAIQDEIQKIAQETGRPFEPNVYELRMDTEKKFNTSQQGNAVRTMNTAIDHMDSLRQDIKQLPTGQYPLMNDIITKYSRNVGDPRINSYDAMASIIAAEVTKAIVANGGTGDERQEKEKLLAVRNNPEALRGVLTGYTKLLGGQLHELQTQYEAGHGKHFENKVSPRTREAIKEATQTRSSW